MNVKLLQEGARSLGVELSGQAVGRLEQYMGELLRWNRSINLTAITQSDEIIAKHFVDSMSIVPLLRPHEHLLDVGSGAGLPGLVVAMLRDDLPITSVDAVDKKVRFQRHICRLLTLDQVEAIHQRVERLAEQRPGQFDLVSSRAFRDPLRFMQLAHPLVRPGGRLVAMVANTGGIEEWNMEQCACDHGFRLLEMRSYELPRQLGARKLVVFGRNPL
ncbi:16S rRNA (guanine(527)-N(7))-methyltransferase RsmG [Trichlorobacter sp.]|uniref:16S rRNA (guanine(527)-N(7))-methyltransferase RsmG n=1 Tax=Trichlorobacter sp. TaxID=2911007 RepID=UPI002A35A26B|nr:16S rRNA (guanine(527)-N(7))-methyltransferase RsmG [Trichlorobacter sp.]MDY0385048.1 16S rRNA (guanine(527)-N(7))-methyltransferase RsmG [Trichlorobacter sp.]